MSSKDNIQHNYDIAPRVYRQIRDECDLLCRHCKRTADDAVTVNEDGIYYHSNRSICEASTIRRIWDAMLKASKGQGL
jgi:hypothetical protein